MEADIMHIVLLKIPSALGPHTATGEMGIMRRDTVAVYIHLVWATWDRLPLITPPIERSLHRIIASEAQKMGCTLLALNSVPDHLHILVRMPATMSVAELVKRLKGVSSCFVNETLKPPQFFRWQGYYGAFSVSRWDVEQIMAYIRRQKEHHAAGDLIPELESVFEEVEIDQPPAGAQEAGDHGGS